MPSVKLYKDSLRAQNIKNFNLPLLSDKVPKNGDPIKFPTDIAAKNNPNIIFPQFLPVRAVF